MTRLAKLDQKTVKKAQCLLDAGWSHTVGLKADGTVIAVGENEFGQCNVSEWQDIVSVVAGSDYTVGIKSDKTVVATGNNKWHQCNVSKWREIVAVAADTHTIGLKSDGTVVAVGDNGAGQCNVSGWKNIIAVATGEKHTVGLKSDGTVVAVGDNSCGQSDLSSWHNIIAVAAGTYFTVGLKSDGTLVAVGSIGHIRDDGTVVPGDLSIIGFGCDNTYRYDVSGWKNIIAIRVGYTNLVGLRSDGTTVAMGLNIRQNMLASIDKQQETGWNYMAAVAVGYQHVVGLKQDGTVIATGENENGQCNIFNWRLFNNIDTLEEERRAVKTQHEKQCKRMDSARKRIEVASRFIATGSYHVIVLQMDGTVIALGENSVGQCNVSGWKNITAVAAYGGLSVGLKSDGTVVTAGNVYSEGRRYCDTSDWTGIARIAAVPSSSVYSEGCVVGWKSDGSILSTDPCIQDVVSNQTDIVSLSKYNNRILCLKSDGVIAGESAMNNIKNIIAISTGISYQSEHIVCLKNDGTVSAIGNNEYGQCRVSDWKSIVAIDTYGTYTAGLKEDGTVVVLGPPAGISSMQSISSWTSIAAVKVGMHFVVGLRKDGTVVASGQNNYGECNISGIRLFNNLDTVEDDLQRIKRRRQEEVEKWKKEQKELAVRREKEYREMEEKRKRAHDQAVADAKKRLQQLESELKRLNVELLSTSGVFSGRKRKNLQLKINQMETEMRCLEDTIKA